MISFLSGAQRLLPVIAGVLGILLSTGCREKNTDPAMAAQVGERQIIVEENPVPRPTPPPTAQSRTDIEFDEFLQRLRDGVGRRDIPLVASLMTPNFGYRLEPLGEGPGVFEYWEANNIWDELELIVSQPWLDGGGFKVSPPAFADPVVPYNGFRAGAARTPSGWRFAYFVRD